MLHPFFCCAVIYVAEEVKVSIFGKAGAEPDVKIVFYGVGVGDVRIESVTRSISECAGRQDADDGNEYQQDADKTVDFSFHCFFTPFIGFKFRIFVVAID